MSEFVKCEKCGGEMKVVDAHHDSDCFQSLLDWECSTCGAGHSETCPDYDDDQDDWDDEDIPNIDDPEYAELHPFHGLLWGDEDYPDNESEE